MVADTSPVLINFDTPILKILDGMCKRKKKSRTQLVKDGVHKLLKYNAQLTETERDYVNVKEKEEELRLIEEVSKYVLKQITFGNWIHRTIRRMFYNHIEKTEVIKWLNTLDKKAKIIEQERTLIDIKKEVKKNFEVMFKDESIDAERRSIYAKRKAKLEGKKSKKVGG